MIKKTPRGFKVTSESGKNLSKPNLSKPAAEKRLAQVEFFKNRVTSTLDRKHGK